MASSLETRAAPGANAPDLHAFEHHWQDEADAAFLYDVLASAEPDERKRDLYRKLSAVEQRHVEIWGNLLRANGREARHEIIDAAYGHDSFLLEEARMTELIRGFLA